MVSLTDRISNSNRHLSFVVSFQSICVAFSFFTEFVFSSKFVFYGLFIVASDTLFCCFFTSTDILSSVFYCVEFKIVSFMS